MAEEGSLLGPAALRQIMQLIRAENARVRNPDAGHRAKSPINESETLQGLLAEDLDAATDPISGETTATLDVYYRDPSSGDLVDAGRSVTVTNRYTSFSRREGDYLVVTWIEQEWRPHLVIRPPSIALAKLTSSICPDDFCVGVECVVNADCHMPTAATNLFKKKAAAGSYVFLAQILPCPEAECEIDLCEESGSSSGGSSWVIVEVSETPLDQLPGYSASKTQALKHDPVGDGSGSSSAGGCVGLSWIDVEPCEEDSASDSGSDGSGGDGGGGGGDGPCEGWEYGNNGEPIGVYEWNGSIWDQVEGTGSFVCDDGGTGWIEGSEAQCPSSREGSFVGETANGYCIHETA